MILEELNTLLQQVFAQDRLGNYDEVERLSGQILTELSASADIGERETEARALQAGATRMLGIVSWMRGDYPNGLAHINEALAISEEIHDNNGIINALGNIAGVYEDLSDYQKALDYLGRALRLCEEAGNRKGVATLLGNSGLVHSRLADYTKALEYLGKALSIAEELGDKEGAAYHLGNIGNVHTGLSDCAKALEYHGKSLAMKEELGYKQGVAGDLHNIGNVHWQLKDYATALEYYNSALKLNEELGNRAWTANNLGSIGGIYMELSDCEKALEYLSKALSIAEELGDRSGVAVHLINIAEVHRKLKNFSQSKDYYERSLRLAEELGTRSLVLDVRDSLGALYANADYPGHDEVKAEEYLLESIAESEELGTKKYEAYKTLAELYEGQGRLNEAMNKLKNYHRLKDEVLSEEAKKLATQMEQRKQIAEREKEIAIAKTAADAQLNATTSLLHRVLPQSIAQRIIDGEQEIADYYTSVSILFADIAGFTPISADMPAIVVVRFLNFVFAQFDSIMKRHECEKIKTIGDGYMAVAGAPTTCDDHAERLAAAAIEMQQPILLPDDIREHMPSGTKLGVRIGLHTGSVVAGVIGEERFVYDIYSDAVNIAARMESHGEEDKIHVSNDFYRHLQNRFAMTKNRDGKDGKSSVYTFEKRGEMEIKGKGLMRTYFLERA